MSYVNMTEKEMTLPVHENPLPVYLWLQEQV